MKRSFFKHSYTMDFLRPLFGIFVLISQIYCIDFKEEYFDQKIDHFNFLSNGNKTFPQRYLYNDSWWDAEKGPIFFYAGNEGNIQGFWDNTGFIFETAAYFHALVLFGEHRYYGKSLPFGNSSFERTNIGYLTMDQALADYAFLINYAKQRFRATDCKVIAFGGSYGGILAAYMRFKYPNVILGSIASSAPIYQIAGLMSGTIFFQSVTKIFRDISPNCESQVRLAFSTLQTWSQMGKAGLQKMSRYFHLCNDLTSQKDYEQLLLWIRNAFVYAAMMNYPYPASFMGNFPAFPVKVMCNLLLSSSSSVDGLYSATALYYNSTGTSKCFDLYKEYVYCSDPTGCGLGNDGKAWDYQACTEMNQEGGTNGVTDMFPVLLFNSSTRDEYCLKTWNVLPRRDFLKTVYWGYDISTASNIVFTNGDLDPWAAGGVLKNISSCLVAFIVKGGAHHLDLRGQNPNDPISVKTARSFEKDNIRKWLESKYPPSC